ncbi:MAG: sulfite exporter TauE/SafE family protein [Verrucomicrobiota bacterium]
MYLIFPIIFLAVAWLYAMVGFGGGSTYIALLAISGLPLTAVPVLALICNLVVSSQGSALLVKRGYAEWSILAPLLLGSIPCAFLGGAWRLPEEAFTLILAIALSLAGLAMLIQGSINSVSLDSPRRPRIWILLGTGVILGSLAGITGIGGGIYLAPVMHLMCWARPQVIAACTSLFIALNSLSGLLGQFAKDSSPLEQIPTVLLVACPLAVLVGGRVGSSLLSSRLPSGRVRLLTAIVIILVSFRLWLSVLVG